MEVLKNANVIARAPIGHDDVYGLWKYYLRIRRGRH